MGSANCCKKPEEILIDEIKNNGEGDKVNPLDQDSYPQDTEYVLKANMNPEEENVPNQKLYEQEGSPRIDGAYELAVNESSPIKYKPVESSNQNDSHTPAYQNENENQQMEIDPQNINQYSPEELATYQNQIKLNANADVNEDEIDQNNHPDDTQNENIKQNKEIQNSNISNASNKGGVDLAVLASQKSAAPINSLTQVVQANQIIQTPLSNNQVLNIQKNIIQQEQKQINNQIQVKEPEEGEDLNKYFQIPTSLAKSKTTIPNNINLNAMQNLIGQNQIQKKNTGNVASVTPLEGNDDINQYFTQLSPQMQQNENLSDQEILNRYFSHAVSEEIKPENIVQNQLNLQNIVNLKDLPDTFGSANIQQVVMKQQPQTTTTTTVTKTSQNLPGNDINNNIKQKTVTTTTKTTGNVDLRNIPSALTNSEIKRIVDMKDLPSTFGSNDINNFQQKTTTTTTTTKTTGNVDLSNIPSALTNSEIKKIVDMKDLPTTFGSNDINNFQQKTTTTTTTTTTKTSGNVDLRNIPSALTNSEIKRIVDMKDLPTTFGSNDINNFNQKTTTTTTTTQTTGSIPKALTPEEIQKIINMKDLPETIGSSTMTNVKKTTVTTTTNASGNNINNLKPITTTTKTETTGSIPKALTQEEIQKIINMKDLPETIGSSTMTNVKKTTVTTTSTSPANIDLKQFGLEQNPSLGPTTSEPIDLKQFGLEPTSSAVSNTGNKQVTTVTKTVQNSGVLPTEDYSKYFQNIQTSSSPIDLQQFGLEKNESNISNILQGSNITFKQPGQSVVSSTNNTQYKKVISSATSTPVITTTDYNQYFKTGNTITTTGNQNRINSSAAVNPAYNYTVTTPYTKTKTTTTTTKTSGIPVSTTSYVTKNYNYNIPTNYTTNKVTTTKTTKSYEVPVQTTGYNYSYSYNIPTTTTTTTTIKK